MSVLVRGMEMPRNCWDCPLINTKPCPCKGYSTALEHVTDRHADCPLVPVPPHGRLIDADALIGQYKGDIWTAKIDYAEGVRDVVEDIKAAPTIIPAEEADE